MTHTTISVWKDSTSAGRDNACWIVSRDEIEDDYRSTYSVTLGVYATHTQARRAAEHAADCRGLPIHDTEEN